MSKARPGRRRPESGMQGIHKAIMQVRSIDQVTVGPEGRVEIFLKDPTRPAPLIENLDAGQNPDNPLRSFIQRIGSFAVKILPKL